MKDYLDTTSLTIPGQNFALISVVSPEGNQKGDVNAVKILGVFNQKVDADEHAKKLVKIDPDFDVFLVELYKWLPIPPDTNAIESQEYQESALNNIISTHKENQEMSKTMFDERVKKLQNGEEDPIDAVTASQVLEDIS